MSVALETKTLLMSCSPAPDVALPVSTADTPDVAATVPLHVADATAAAVPDACAHLLLLLIGHQISLIFLLLRPSCPCLKLSFTLTCNLSFYNPSATTGLRLLIMVAHGCLMVA